MKIHEEKTSFCVIADDVDETQKFEEYKGLKITPNQIPYSARYIFQTFVF